MPNDFYTRAYNPLPEQRVSSQVLKDEFARVEAGFDEVQGDAARAIKLPVGTAADQTLDMDAGARANLVLAFDAAGNITAISYGRFRGDWLTETAYVVSDYFRDPVSKNVYAVTAAHTSGVLADDITAGKVRLAINVADVEAAKAAANAAAETAIAQASLAGGHAEDAAEAALVAINQAAVAAGIDKRYLGAKDADPALDNQGAALIEGALYFNTVFKAMRSWNGSAWEAAYLPASGYVTEAPTDGNSYARKDAGWAAVVSKVVRSARTSNTQLAAADAGKWIDITSGTFSQTFDAVATLGDGWYCYLGNSGTGDITLDPNASETIDGLTSYVMYPGEVRLVQCDGAALRSIVLNAFSKTFTASGSLIKPPGYRRFDGILWGAGASGPKQSSGVARAGGGGGSGLPFSLSALVLAATESIVIGAGGAAVTTNATAGNAGGNSSFGVVQAGGGTCPTVNGGIGGHAGGLTTATSSDGFAASPADGFRAVFGGAASNASSFVYPYFGGGGADGATNPQVRPYYGGSAGGSLTGGGAPIAPSGSVFGGVGGAASAAGNGVAGTAPGGGGGATGTGAQSGAGARGEMQVWGII